MADAKHNTVAKAIMENLQQSTYSEKAAHRPRVVSHPESFGVVWDRAAHAEIARRHGALLYKLARHLTANESDACDLVQDTFETSLRKLPAGLAEDRIGHWLMVTLRNRYIDRRRSPERRSTGEIPETALAIAPPQEQEEPEEPSWAGVEAQAVEGCAERLNPILRDVFFLRVRERQSHHDIARQLGIPLSTVGTRYFRALKHLRGMLEKLS